MTASTVKEAPVGELGADVWGVLPGWDILGGALRGSTVDREEVSLLRWPNSVRVFSRMRNDTQLSGLYRGTTLGIRRYVWGIDPNGANPEIVDAVCRDFNLQTIDKAWQAFETGQSDPTRRAQNQFLWDRHQADAQRGLYYGHYYFELHGAIGSDGFWHPVDASARSPWTIEFIWVATNGDLIAVKQNIASTQNMAGGILNFPELEAGRLVPYVFDQEPGDWTGRSMFRSCYREWLLKDRLLRVDLVNHEKAGGILLNEAPKDATPAQIQALADLAQSAQMGGGGAIPSGTTPIFLRGTGSDIIGSINRHDEAMAREFLMMFMSLGTSSSGGNRALASSFIDWFALSQEAIATWQRDTFQKWVIERYIAWNWGDQDYVPTLAYKRPEEANPLDRLAAAITTPAGTPGAILDPNQQAIDPTSAVPVAAIRFGAPGAVVVDDELRDTILTAHHDYEAWARPKPRSTRVAATTSGFRRDLYPHEVQAATDFTAVDTNWQNSVDQLVADWKSIRAGQIEQLANQVAAAGGDLTTLAQIKAVEAGGDLLATRLTAMAHTGASQAVGEAAAQGVIAPAQPNLAALKDELAARASALEQLLTTSISQAAANKAVQISGGSLTADEVAGQVRDYLTSLSDAYLSDTFGGALNAAQNGGRLAAMTENQASSFYASELLDQNTCPPCAEEDGTEFASADEAAAAYPAGGYVNCAGGPRCRGTVVAVYDEAAPSA